MGQFKDLSGCKFGHWTVMRRVESPCRATLWLCRCDCGQEAVVRGGSLCNGSSQSCGCVKNQKTAKRMTKHGHRYERLYWVWLGIKQRCTNPNCKDYPHYGARGIIRCPEWDDYGVFRDWAVTHGYAPGLTIERVNVNGNYCPENCTWIPKAEQGKNTTRTTNNKTQG